MTKDYIKGDDERRFISPKIEVRNDDEDRTVIEGVAIVVGRKTNLGWFDEIVAPGAFDERMNDDVVALFNHDPNLPLARTTSQAEGHLELYKDTEGNLAYRFMIPNTTIGKDLAENIRTGVITSSSFAFRIAEDKWEYADSEKENDLRTILKLERLYDISPVTYPAYNDTSVAVRSLERSHETEERQRELIDKDRAEMDILCFDVGI